MLSASDRQQLDRALAVVREVVESEVVGAYLFGSAVLGGLREESDLDILIVLRRPTTRAEKERLAHGLMAISGKSTPEGIWRRIELTTVAERDVRPWRYPPSMDFQYGDWLRSDFEGGRFEPWPTSLKPDLALLITMVIGANSPILGPPPVGIFEPVPSEDLRSAMTSDIDRLQDDIGSDTRNVILTLARMWSTLATGVIRSKDGAADWALERLPEEHRPVLARARDVYLGRGTERWDDLKESIPPHVDYMVAEIKRLAGTRPGQAR
jgi:predicted nucleotidyltransferase